MSEARHRLEAFSLLHAHPPLDKIGAAAGSRAKSLHWFAVGEPSKHKDDR
jgi:hypothetical protein